MKVVAAGFAPKVLPNREFVGWACPKAGAAVEVAAPNAGAAPKALFSGGFCCPNRPVPVLDVLPKLNPVEAAGAPKAGLLSVVFPKILGAVVVPACPNVDPKAGAAEAAGCPKTLPVVCVFPNRPPPVAGCVVVPKPLNMELVVLLVAVLLKPNAGAEVAGVPNPLNKELFWVAVAPNAVLVCPKPPRVLVCCPKSPLFSG